MRYVEYLREIGDSTSLLQELLDVQRQLRRDECGGCAMPQAESERYLSDTIKSIGDRIEREKTHEKPVRPRSTNKGGEESSPPFS